MGGVTCSGCCRDLPSFFLLLLLISESKVNRGSGALSHLPNVTVAHICHTLSAAFTRLLFFFPFPFIFFFLLFTHAILTLSNARSQLQHPYRPISHFMPRPLCCSLFPLLPRPFVCFRFDSSLHSPFFYSCLSTLSLRRHVLALIRLSCSFFRAFFMCFSSSCSPVYLRFYTSVLYLINILTAGETEGF